MVVSYKVIHTLRVGPNNPTLRYLPKRNEIPIYIKICDLIFIAALFIIAKQLLETIVETTWPSTGEWTNKLWYVQIMGYCSAIERHKLLTLCNQVDAC